jgi:hypothetical protein
VGNRQLHWRLSSREDRWDDKSGIWDLGVAEIRRGFVGGRRLREKGAKLQHSNVQK